MEAKKKLMLICPMLHQGGFERVCVTTAKLMQPYFDVVIVIFDSADIAYDVEGLNIVDICMGVRKGKLNKILNIIRRSLKVRQLKKKMNPDIAYSFGPTANMVNAFSKTGKEKVWLGLRSYGDLAETIKMKLFLRLADLIVCCSAEMKQQLQMKYGYEQGVSLYNPFDVDKIQTEAKAGSPQLPWKEVDEQGRKIRYLVSMGRDDVVKGFWHMVKAFACVHKEIPESRLMIIGEGMFERERQLAGELGILEYVWFAGLQKRPYEYLKKGELYLLTSELEGFPNALVEGMALGLVPISVNCLTGPAEILMEEGNIQKVSALLEAECKKGNVPMAFGEYGILIPPMNNRPDYSTDVSEEEERLSEIMIQLMNDKEMLCNYQSAATERAKMFSYKNYVENFLKFAE